MYRKGIDDWFCLFHIQRLVAGVDLSCTTSQAMMVCEITIEGLDSGTESRLVKRKETIFLRSLYITDGSGKVRTCDQWIKELF